MSTATVQRPAAMRPAGARNSSPQRKETVARAGRRSMRLTLRVPLLVSGKTTKQVEFRESTFAVKINTHGGLITLKHAVRRGDRILLRHDRWYEEAECRIVFVGSEQGGHCTVGVEFLDTRKNFWHTCFPECGSRPLMD